LVKNVQTKDDKVFKLFQANNRNVAEVKKTVSYRVVSEDGFGLSLSKCFSPAYKTHL